MISPERQSWYCFGACSEGGDLIKFLMKYENLEFYEALKILAERTGVELQRSGSDWRQYEILYVINESAKNFFKNNLSEAGRSYYHSRGLKDETIEEFDLGMAPAGSDQLRNHLIKAGFNISDIERAGLAFRTERGTYWDRFRNRLMFPIYNNVGRVIGFTGRIYSDPNTPMHPNDPNVSKYVNSPETPIFNKSKNLYGFHKTKSAIRDQGAVMLVEGQMDFLMAYQAGIKNVVAVSGTALTSDHLRTLRRLTDSLILSFDQDEAGQKAAERGIDLALANDFSLSVTALPGKDPADLAKEDPEQLQKIISASRPIKDFYFDRYLKPASEPRQFKLNIRLLLTKIRNLFSDVEKALWLRDLSSRTGVGEAALMAEMEKLAKPAGIDANIRINANDTNIKNADAEINRKGLIIQRILQLGGSLPEGFVVTAVNDALALKAAWENSKLSQEEQGAELKQLFRQLKIESCKEQIAGLKTVIAQAERENNETQLLVNLSQIDKLGHKLHNLIHYGEEAQN